MWLPHQSGASKQRSAFTLIEVLVVIGVIGVLLAMTFPAIQMLRESARRTQCLDQVRQVTLALFCGEAQSAKFPPGVASLDARPFGSSTWLQAILPHMELRSIADQASSDYAYSPSPFHGHTGMWTVVSAFQCLSDPRSDSAQWTHDSRLVATTSYVGVNGTDWEAEDGIFYRDSATRMADIIDGTSNTLMIGERPPSPDFWYGWWYAGFGQQGTGSCDMLLGVRERKAPPTPGVKNYLEDCPDGPYRFEAGKPGRMCDTFHYWSYHPGGAIFGFADGSVRFLSYGADEVMPQLATIAGGEVVAVPE